MPPKQNRKWRHHYVPEHVLKNFANPSGLLHHIDRHTGNRRQDIPRNIGFIRDFYLVDEEDPNTIENGFSRFETKAAPVIQSIVDTQRFPDKKEDIQTLGYFIALQSARVPATREMISRPMHRTDRIMASMMQDSEPLYKHNAHQIGVDPDKLPWQEFRWMDLETFVRPISTEQFVEHSFNIANTIGKFVSKRLWTLVHSKEPDERFVVSDDPVVLWWKRGIDQKLPPGHAHANSEVTVPLSSNVALIGTYERFQLPDEAMRQFVAWTNYKTIYMGRHFVAADDDHFLLLHNDEIIDSARFVEMIHERKNPLIES